MMRTKNKSLLSLCCFFLITFAACEAKELAISPPYPVIDSGVWADYLYDPQINWIDNNRILFKSVKDNDKRRVSSGPFNLSMWEIGKEVRAYTPYVKRVSACANDGIVKYTLEEESGRYRVFYGKFGEEKEITPPKLSYPDLVKNCRIADNPEIVAKRQNNRAIIPLLDRHGYLELGPSLGKESSTNTPITLYRPGQPNGIVLSHRRQEIGSAPEYFAFKDAYFIQPINLYYKGRDNPATVWWLFPDGTVMELKIPVGPWVMGGDVRAYPTIKGTFLTFHTLRTPKDPGPAGGYLVEGNKFTKVINGDIAGPAAISPDGCKVALSHAPYSEADYNVKDPVHRALKVINFCPEEKKHAQ